MKHLSKKEKKAAELKFLTAIYADEVLKGHTVRQERPLCCARVIDFLGAEVTFREISVGKKIFHLLEPVCPICGKRVEPVYQLLS